jgi:membrane-bound ClpP family serine protease
MFKRFKKESVYLKVYGFYLVISSFTTAESFRIGIFGVICIYLYLVVLEAGSNAEPLNKASN